MASTSRSAVLKQVQLLSSSRVFAATTQPLRFTRPAPILSRQLATPRWTQAPRFAPFSTTAARKILPPGPQVVQGTVNDPAHVPKPNPLHGSYHWTAERLIAIGLVPLTITPFAAGSLNPTLDAIFVFALLVHSHIGFQACIVDYIPQWQHPTMRKVFDWLLNIATLVVAVGFYEFETNDVGVTEAIKRIWRAGDKEAA